LVALVTSIWLVACCLLGARHEARAAHYVDGHGRAFHGSRMTGEHTASQSDVHSRDATPELDACGIAAALHQPAAISEISVSVGVRASDPDRLTLTLTPTLPAGSILRIAPKTSPPTIAR